MLAPQLFVLRGVDFAAWTLGVFVVCGILWTISSHFLLKLPDRWTTSYVMRGLCEHQMTCVMLGILFFCWAWHASGLGFWRFLVLWCLAAAVGHVIWTE